MIGLEVYDIYPTIATSATSTILTKIVMILTTSLTAQQQLFEL